MQEYDPKRISVVFKGIQLQGYADDTFVQAERSNDMFSMQIGADGQVTRVRSRNKSGSVTCTLQSASVSNSLLSDLMLADENFGTSVGPIMIKDNNGTTLCYAGEAWIRKAPNVSYGVDASTREWVFDCADLSIYAGNS